MVLLGTTTCIHLLNGTDVGLTRRVLSGGPERLAVSALTAGELHFGSERSSRPQANRELLETFLCELTVVPFDALCSERFATIKVDLPSRGRPIPDFDVASSGPRRLAAEPG